MRRALSSKLENKQVGLSYVTSGIYQPNYGEYIVMKPERREEQVQLLDSKELAEQINSRLLDPKTSVSLREFVSQHEWDAYEDFQPSKWK